MSIGHRVLTSIDEHLKTSKIDLKDFALVDYTNFADAPALQVPEYVRFWHQHGQSQLSFPFILRGTLWCLKRDTGLSFGILTPV